MKSKIIAISSISAGIIAIILTFGAYFEIADLFCVALASVVTIFPLYYKTYLGCFIAYLVGGIVAFFASGLNILSLVFITYFLFGGIYPLVSIIFRDKKINKYVILIFGAIWCILIFYLSYFYYISVMNGIVDDLPSWILDGIYYFIGILGLIFYFVFDRFIYFGKIFIIKNLKRVLR